MSTPEEESLIRKVQKKALATLRKIQKDLFTVQRKNLTLTPAGLFDAIGLPKKDLIVILEESGFGSAISEGFVKQATVNQLNNKMVLVFKEAGKDLLSTARKEAARIKAAKAPPTVKTRTPQQIGLEDQFIRLMQRWNKVVEAGKEPSKEEFLPELQDLTSSPGRTNMINLIETLARKFKELGGFVLDRKVIEEPEPPIPTEEEEKAVVLETPQGLPAVIEREKTPEPEPAGFIAPPGTLPEASPEAEQPDPEQFETAQPEDLPQTVAVQPEPVAEALEQQLPVDIPQTQDFSPPTPEDIAVSESQQNLPQEPVTPSAGTGQGDITLEDTGAVAATMAMDQVADVSEMENQYAMDRGSQPFPVSLQSQEIDRFDADVNVVDSDVRGNVVDSDDSVQLNRPKKNAQFETLLGFLGQELDKRPGLSKEVEAAAKLRSQVELEGIFNWWLSIGNAGWITAEAEKSFQTGMSDFSLGAAHTRDIGILISALLGSHDSLAERVPEPSRAFPSTFWVDPTGFVGFSGIQSFGKDTTFREYSFSDHPSSIPSNWKTKFLDITEYHPTKLEHLQEMRAELEGKSGTLVLAHIKTGRQKEVSLDKIKLFQHYVWTPKGHTIEKTGGGFWPLRENHAWEENDKFSQYTFLRGANDKIANQSHRLQVPSHKQFYNRPHTHVVRQRQMGGSLWSWLKGAAKTVGRGIVKGVKAVGHSIHKAVDATGRFVIKTGKAIGRGVKDFAGDVVDTGKRFVQRAGQDLRHVGQFFTDPSWSHLKGAIGGLGKIVLDAGDGVIREIGNAVNFVQKTPVINLLNTAAQFVVPGLGAFENLTNAANFAVRGDFKGVLGVGRDIAVGRALGAAGGKAFEKIKSALPASVVQKAVSLGEKVGVNLADVGSGFSHHDVGNLSRQSNSEFSKGGSTVINRRTGGALEVIHHDFSKGHDFQPRRTTTRRIRPKGPLKDNMFRHKRQQVQLVRPIKGKHEIGGITIRQKFKDLGWQVLPVNFRAETRRRVPRQHRSKQGSLKKPAREPVDPTDTSLSDNLLQTTDIQKQFFNLLNAIAPERFRTLKDVTLTNIKASGPELIQLSEAHPKLQDIATAAGFGSIVRILLEPQNPMTGDEINEGGGFGAAFFPSDLKISDKFRRSFKPSALSHSHVLRDPTGSRFPEVDQSFETGDPTGFSGKRAVEGAGLVDVLKGTGKVITTGAKVVGAVGKAGFKGVVAAGKSIGDDLEALGKGGTLGAGLTTKEKVGIGVGVGAAAVGAQVVKKVFAFQNLKKLLGGGFVSQFEGPIPSPTNPYQRPHTGNFSLANVGGSLLAPAPNPDHMFFNHPGPEFYRGRTDFPQGSQGSKNLFSHMDFNSRHSTQNFGNPRMSVKKPSRMPTKFVRGPKNLHGDGGVDPIEFMPKKPLFDDGSRVQFVR